MSAVEPFSVHVEDEVLDDLRRRLEQTRFPDQIPGTGWEYGMPVPYLRELVAYWLDEYDWRAQEVQLNRFDHFRTEVDGQPIHFVHARSARDGALPILISHGWPGSIVEFLDVIPLVTDEFDVVAPSLPGYGFSGPTTSPGWDSVRIGQAFVELMSRLGYDRYGAQGGDWGAQVTTRIGGLDAEHCVGIHLNMPIADPPKDPAELSEQEQADLKALQAFRQQESGYAMEQSTKPQTLGAGLNDSPAGLLAWIVEKFRAWSDCHGDPENAFTKDQLITNVMLYWVTGTATSSARLYWEHIRQVVRDGSPPRVEVPTGVARYPKEILRYPRSWVEQQYHVTHWADLPEGGHFAAMEKPEVFADDLKTFFRTVG